MFSMPFSACRRQFQIQFPHLHPTTCPPFLSQNTQRHFSSIRPERDDPNACDNRPAHTRATAPFQRINAQTHMLFRLKPIIILRIILMINIPSKIPKNYYFKDNDYRHEETTVWNKVIYRILHGTITNTNTNRVFFTFILVYKPHDNGEYYYNSIHNGTAQSGIFQKAGIVFFLWTSFINKQRETVYY